MAESAADESLCRVFRNDKALFVWGLVGVWLLLLGGYTWLVWRDGGIPQIGRWSWPLLGVFWLCGVAAASWAANFCLLRLELSANGLLLRERFPLYLRVSRYPARELRAPRVERVLDGDGDERFDCVLDLPRERHIVVAESIDRAAMQRYRDDLLASLRAVCRDFNG